MLFERKKQVVYISPEKEVNAGLWTLFAGATLFLGLRIWCKVIRRTGLWYDDYMLVISWLVLMATNIFITVEYATGYSTGFWDDHMHILINISSCGTLVGAALSKTALGITLLRMSNRVQSTILWACILSMNLFMIIKVFFQWAKYCGKHDYQNWYRLDGPCINYDFEEKFKVGGNTDNIVMDFVFACFPWWITWNLEMRRMEKIALCFTMSLGMFVAIISAIRTTWKDRDIMHHHDEYYIWRNGMSNIWYSAEVAGTIIVQCIPLLRPLLREIHTTFTSSQLHDTEDAKSFTWRSRSSTFTAAKRTSHTASSHASSNTALRNSGSGIGRLIVNDKGQVVIAPAGEDIPLDVIPEEGRREGKESRDLREDWLVDFEALAEPLRGARMGGGDRGWPFSNEDFERDGETGKENGSDPGETSPRSNRESDMRSPVTDYFWDSEEDEDSAGKGLSPPPPRIPPRIARP